MFQRLLKRFKGGERSPSRVPEGMRVYTIGGTPPGNAGAIRLDFDSPDFLADPYPLYPRLRAADAVHRSPWSDRYLPPLRRRDHGAERSAVSPGIDARRHASTTPRRGFRPMPAPA